jgi:hypothetical protein
VGDVVFLPHGRGHTLADSPKTLATAPACGPDDPRLSEPYASDSVDRTGDGGPVTVVLCGTYQLDPSRTHPLLRDLPDRIHLPAHPDRHPELRSAVELLAAELDHPRLGTDAAVPALLAGPPRSTTRRSPPPSTPSTGPRRHRGQWRNSPRKQGFPAHRSPGASPP